MKYLAAALLLVLAYLAWHRREPEAAPWVEDEDGVQPVDVRTLAYLA